MQLATSNWQPAEKTILDVIPAKAGIQSCLTFLDSCLRGSDARSVLAARMKIVPVSA